MTPRVAEPRAPSRVAAVLGHPIGHSISPAIHNAAFAAAGLDWTFVALDVDEPRGSQAFAGAAALNFGGLSVTMPLKAIAAASMDRLASPADVLHAVNTVVLDQGMLVGHNTDGAGFVDAITIEHGTDPAGLSVVVLGAGGAARAVALALGHAGAAEVVVVNRTPDRAASTAALVAAAGGRGRAGQVDDIARADIIVNATPLGMQDSAAAGPPDGGRDFRQQVIATLRGNGQLFVDLAYAERRSDLLQSAAATGARVADGAAMLVHQAARAFELWTGVAAPLATMRSAALMALGRDAL